MSIKNVSYYNTFVHNYHATFKLSILFFAELKYNNSRPLD